MKYKELSRSGVVVPVIGQGCMGVGRASESNDAIEREHVHALQLGIDLGLTLIDTAEIYGAGRSEELIAQAILGRREKVILADKFSPENSEYDGVLSACHASLGRLRTDYIDLYQVHWPNSSVPVSDTLGAMERLLDEGKIRAIGVSNFGVAELAEALGAGETSSVVSNQVEYSLFDRYIEASILPYCLKHHVTVMAYSPLDKGRIVDGSRKHRILSSLAERYSRTPSQIALNWLTRRSNGVAIPKASNPEHLRENAQAVDFDLTEEDFERIADVFVSRPEAIEPHHIEISLSGEFNRSAYTTLDAALTNHMGFTPSPAELAESLKGSKEIKPVRLVRKKNLNSPKAFELVEGRVRYWAWVIAYGWDAPLPAYVREPGSGAV